MNGKRMLLLSAVTIVPGLASAFARLPMHGIWWHCVSWAFHPFILAPGAGYGPSAGSLAGVAAPSLFVFKALRGMGDASLSSTAGPALVVAGLLSGVLLKVWSHFRQPQFAREPDPWPALGRISERVINLALNPLASIESAVRLLAENDTPAEMREELATIVLRECQQLSANITGLLHQNSAATLPVPDADIAGIVDSVVTETAFLLSGRGIIVRTIGNGIVGEDGREEVLTEHLCDWTDCANVTEHVLGFVGELASTCAVCREHAAMLCNRGSDSGAAAGTD